MATEPLPKCMACGAPMERVRPAYPGYREGTSFTILQCSVCRLGQASPTVPDPALYSAIYRQGTQAPGYSRYWYYREALARHPRYGLEFLSSLEDVYWGVQHSLREERVPTGARVLDVGSGLGYLTAALRRGGLDAWGLEVSPEAVEAARRTFGEFFYLEEGPDRSPPQLEGSFDVVLLLEIVEHVADPSRLIERALSMMRPNGRLILTTPNRSYFSSSETWQTDPPPIHLWWFTEESIRRQAEKLRLNVRFLDFAEYNRRHPVGRSLTRSLTPDERAPIMGRDGSLLKVEPRLQRALRASGTYGIARAVRDRALVVRRHIGSRDPNSRTLHERPTMCVVISKFR